MAMRFFDLKLEVRNVSAVVANLYSYDELAQKGFRRAVKRAGKFNRDLARSNVAVRTGRTRNAIKTTYSEGELAWRTFVDPAPFAADGEEYYPIFLEFGTEHMEADPFFFSAFIETEAILKADVADEMRKALNRAARVR